MTEIGKLDQRITLQRSADTADGIGGMTKAWADFATTPSVWSHVKPRLGREGMAEGRMSATSLATFTIRYRADVSELDRILWNGEPWNIRRVMRVSQRQQYMDIDAERGVNQ